MLFRSPPSAVGALPNEAAHEEPKKRRRRRKRKRTGEEAETVEPVEAVEVEPQPEPESTGDGRRRVVIADDEEGTFSTDGMAGTRPRPRRRRAS